MARKAKEVVKLRFKTLKNGEKSAYFDIYRNGVREYVWQEGHLQPETDDASIEHNRLTMSLFEERRRSLIAELTIDKSGIANRSFNTEITLLQWLDIYGMELKSRATKTYVGGVKRLKDRIIDFNPDLLLKDLDEHTVTSFYEFLHTQKSAVGDKLLGEGTISCLMKILGNCMNGAIRERLIDNNPCKSVLSACWRNKKSRNTTYLPMTELLKLIDTPFRLEYIKRLFLFCCFTGATPEMLHSLCWKHIYRKDGRIWAELKRSRVNKSKDITVPLTDMAIECLPPRRRAKGSSVVFETRSQRVMETHLQEWAEKAGTDTAPNFIVAKNTYAFLLLNSGADFYTAGYLMGYATTLYMKEYEGYLNGRHYDAVDKLDAALGLIIQDNANSDDVTLR